jgi:16S rRNA (guanine966-N2)-methyltransferase
MTGLVKKSLFGMLDPRLGEATVVDLFCGTGTLGLEALSRGARACWFADRDRDVLAVLRRNIQALGLAGRATVWGGDVAASLGERLASIGAPVDVAFVDPPFAAARSWSWHLAAGRILLPLAAALAPLGVVALRLPADVQPPQALGRLRVARVREYGGMTVVLLELSGTAEAGRP